MFLDVTMSTDGAASVAAAGAELDDPPTVRCVIEGLADLRLPANERGVAKARIGVKFQSD